MGVVAVGIRNGAAVQCEAVGSEGVPVGVVVAGLDGVGQ